MHNLSVRVDLQNIVFKTTRRWQRRTTNSANTKQRKLTYFGDGATPDSHMLFANSFKLSLGRGPFFETHSGIGLFQPGAQGPPVGFGGIKFSSRDPSKTSAPLKQVLLIHEAAQLLLHPLDT